MRSVVLLFLSFCVFAQSAAVAELPIDIFLDIDGVLFYECNPEEASQWGPGTHLKITVGGWERCFVPTYATLALLRKLKRDSVYRVTYYSGEVVERNEPLLRWMDLGEDGTALKLVAGRLLSQTDVISVRETGNYFVSPYSTFAGVRKKVLATYQHRFDYRPGRAILADDRFDYTAKGEEVNLLKIDGGVDWPAIEKLFVSGDPEQQKTALRDGNKIFRLMGLIEYGRKHSHADPLTFASVIHNLMFDADHKYLPDPSYTDEILALGLASLREVDPTLQLVTLENWRSLLPIRCVETLPASLLTTVK